MNLKAITIITFTLLLIASLAPNGASKSTTASSSNPPTIKEALTSSVMTCLVFNCASPPFNDTQFRKAIVYMIDRETIISNLTDTAIKPLNTFLPESLDGWVRNESNAEFNLEKAWNTLTDAGYAVNITSNRRINPSTGRDLRDMTIITPPIWEDEAQWVAGETISLYAIILRLPVKHTTMTSNRLRALNSGNDTVDMAVMNLTISLPPHELYNILHSQADASIHSLTGISDPTLDGALEDLKKGANESVQREAAFRIQERLAEIVPYAPICVPVSAKADQTVKSGTHLITFSFEKIGKPSDENSSSTDTRSLAAAFDYVEFLNENRNSVGMTDIGFEGSALLMGAGWYASEGAWDDVENFAWAGNGGFNASVLVEAQVKPTYISFKATSFPLTESVKVIVDDKQVGEASVTRDWHVYTLKLNREQSKIEFSTLAINSTLGELATIRGSLTPPLQNELVTLTVKTPSNHTLTLSNSTGLDGGFVFTLKPGEKGSWISRASWTGNDDYLPSVSNLLTILVHEDEKISGADVAGYPLISLALGLLSSLILIKNIRRHKTEGGFIVVIFATMKSNKKIIEDFL